MIDTPTVDIALATYNGEPYLMEFLHSISQQTNTSWHLVAGDDGSTDRTEILEAFHDAHPEKITLRPSASRLGATANFSRVMNRCRANYTMPADQDDIWLPEKSVSVFKKCPN